MAAYRVKAGAVVAVIGGSDRYLERGVVLPAGVENIDHLKAVGLVEEVALDEPGEDVRRAVQHLPRETPTPPPATA